VCFHHGHVGVSNSKVKKVADNVMAVDVKGLVMVDRVFDAMRMLIGDS
jgi:hypothetical protein